MPFSPAVKNPGDLARSQDWNKAMTEVVRLENDKVDKSGDTITGPLVVGNLKLGNWIGNPSNYVMFGANTLDQNNASNYALLQGAVGSNVGMTFLNSPVDIRFRIGNSTKMILANNGNIGIGLTEPQARLHLAFSSDVQTSGGGTLVIGDMNGLNIAMDNNEIMARNDGANSVLHVQHEGGNFIINGAPNATGNVGIGTGSPNYRLDVRGEIGNNTTRYHSDARWKKNVAPYENALDKVMRLRGVGFEWRTNDYRDMNFPEGPQIGLIAQEVEEVIPEVVSTDRDGFKSVAYANLVAVLIEAVKELQTEVAQLKAELGITRAVPANGHQPVASSD